MEGKEAISWCVADGLTSLTSEQVHGNVESVCFE